MMRLRSEEKNELAPWTVKRQYVVAAIALVVGIILFIIAFVGMKYQIGLGKLDHPVLNWMVQHRTTYMTITMQTITTIASPVPFTILLIGIALGWALKTREIWRPLLLLGATGGAAVVSVVLKNVFVHARPAHALMVKPYEIDYSFPSGHTIAITTFVLIVGYLICSRHTSRARITGWILVSVVGITLVATSRLYLGYHWLTDVTASVGLGLMILALVIVVDKLFVKKEEELQ